MVYFKNSIFQHKTVDSFNKSPWGQKSPNKSFWGTKFREFCQRTDLHGFKYIVMDDLHRVERVSWLLAVAISSAVAVYFVYSAYQWLAMQPIITVIESTQRDIWDVPFPAVTICDLNIISRNLARDFSYNLTLPSNITPEFVFRTLRLAPLLHATYLSGDREKQDLKLLQNILEINNVSIVDLFRKLSPVESCAHLVKKCTWKNKLYDCQHLFQQVFSLLSLCCTFNYYAVDPAYPRVTFPNKLLQKGFPRYESSCGYQTALTVIINTDPGTYYSTSLASQGALVFIDNAYNIPDMDSPVRMVNPSTEMMIALEPELINTSPGVRSFFPEDRQCYYEDEVQIGVFRQYSFHNCMAYRKIKTIEKLCKCVPFYFPLKDKLRHCNFKDLDCLEFILKSSIDSKNYSEIVEGLDIKCLPDCERYTYPLKVSLGYLVKNVHLIGHPVYNGHNLENRSLLNVFFNDLESTTYRRDVYLNWQNVLASFGGLLSLMLGCTLTSGIDVVIFIIMRIGYDVALNTCSEPQCKTTKINVLSKNSDGSQGSLQGWGFT